MSKHVKITTCQKRHPADCWAMWDFWPFFFGSEATAMAMWCDGDRQNQPHMASHQGVLEIFWKCFHLKPRKTIDNNYRLHQAYTKFSVILRFFRSFLSTCIAPTSWDVRFSPQPTWGTRTLEAWLHETWRMHDIYIHIICPYIFYINMYICQYIYTHLCIIFT